MLENLKPMEVFYYFEEISKIPRGSGNERKISDYLVSFAKSNNLNCIQDKALNVIIKKPASQGYENSPSIIIQGHMDMVCEKNNDTIHDFEYEPLKLLIDGDYIKADGTTLGADNGIAVAYSLALLASNSIEHPAIEALFTSDEEVGMNGAQALDATQLSSKILINIDSEEETKLLVSCAGGMKATIHIPIEFESVPTDKETFIIKLRGLRGGHSGSEIDKQRANANKLMGKILSYVTKSLYINIVSIDGGAKDNAIPREANAIIMIENKDRQELEAILKKLNGIYINEFKGCDANILIELEKVSQASKIFSAKTARKVIDTLILIPNGVCTMSLDIKGLVESSTNIGVVKTLETEIIFASAVRSSLSTRKNDIQNQMLHLSQLVGGNLTVKGEYPAWEYNPNSELRNIFLKVYKDMYGKEAEIEAIHAGLECGLFAEKIVNIDMISFGPNIYDAHTPDEKLSISSTARIWEYLKNVLKNIK